MDMTQPVTGFDINKLSKEAQTRWLKPVEVLYILLNHERFEITQKLPQKPPSGSLLLFNRRVLRYFRNDGHSWKKKKNGKTVREGHERLKVGNSEALNCYYAHGEQNSCFQRRSYWMLDLVFEHIVLVHYREVVEGRCMSETILSSSIDSCPTLRYSTSVSNDQAQCFLSHTTEFNDPCQNSCSPGSVEEICLQFIGGNTKMSHSNRMDRSVSCNQLSRSEFNQALRKLEEQLSLENEEDICTSSKEQLLPLCNVQVETHDLQLPSCETRNIQEKALQNPLDMWFDQSQFEAPLQTESSLSLDQRHLFTIREVSPEWAFSSESTKVVITGDFLCSPSEYTWTILFGDTDVPLEIVQDGVFRCLAPLHSAGKVKLCITSGNNQPCSDVHEFEFREKLEITGSSNTLSRAEGTKSSGELLFLVKFAEMLLFGHKEGDEGDLEPKVDPLRKLEGSKRRLEPIIEALQAGSLSPENIRDAIIQELLKDKFHQWLSSKHQGNTNKDDLLSKQEQHIIHMISGLGYQWALHPILNSGVCINYRDSNGWTALHWAANFGREDMVAALHAAGASAGAVTNPSAHDPEGKTPASLAAANGHKGLAAFLSEAALTSHLFSLTTETTERFEGSSVEVGGGVDSISQRIAHLHGDTEDQRSLKDSLAGVRNSAQAASRIQFAFRAYSFRKKQQKATISQGKYDMSPADIHELSAASRWHKASHGFCDQKFDKAALSIQKNYRCWKRRSEFLQIRKYVVKIQAHIRAHLARKKYKEFLWTVGVLEKVILRWHRGRAGFRGFQAEPEYIDEEEDDIIKVFRRQKVERAVDKALSRVLSVVKFPEARQQYRRMLESYQHAKAELGQYTQETS